MTDMVERVSRALDETIESWYADERTEANLDTLGLAIAAIRAMREPTAEMEVAGTEDWLCIRAMEDRSRATWVAMIDAALTSSQSHPQD